VFKNVILERLRYNVEKILYSRTRHSDSTAFELSMLDTWYLGTLRICRLIAFLKTTTIHESTFI